MVSEKDFPVDLNDKERELVKPFFSNTDRNIFGLINLPEVIMGTLFSRYSRSDKSVRRLLLDEFIPNRDVMEIVQGSMPAKGLEASLNVAKAEDFYQRILVGYGDDSVAELAGAHVACENVSSLAGDLLTDSRIGLSPLEKSARYILFDKKVNGRYLWYRDPKLMSSSFERLYSETMELIFDSYSKWVPMVLSYMKEAYPRTEDQTERAYESTMRAKACDVLKNMLPGGRLTNVGLFGNGRAFEYLISKLYSCELPEGNQIAKEMHEELGRVLPAFVKRSQLSEYITGTRDSMWTFARQNLPQTITISNGKGYLKLVDYDQDAEVKVLAAMLYPYSKLSIEELKAIVTKMPLEKRSELISAYLSKRRNRRDKPGRALENTFYTFETAATYGAYRDIHRHRVLTLEKERLSTDLGFEVPSELDAVGLSDEYSKLMLRIAEAHKQIEKEMPIEAQYMVPRSFYLRWYMKMNLREVYHLTELRSTKQGHPDYRKIAQQMKLLIEKIHPALIKYMQVDMSEYALARLESEKRIDKKLAELDMKKKQESDVSKGG